MVKTRISTLISRYLWDILTPDESKQLLYWVSISRANASFFRKACDIDRIMKNIDKKLSSFECTPQTAQQDTPHFTKEKSVTTPTSKLYRLAR